MKITEANLIALWQYRMDTYSHKHIRSIWSILLSTLTVFGFSLFIQILLNIQITRWIVNTGLVAGGIYLLLSTAILVMVKRKSRPQNREPHRHHVRVMLYNIFDLLSSVIMMLAYIFCGLIFTSQFFDYEIVKNVEMFFFFIFGVGVFVASFLFKDLSRFSVA
jgi:MFS family permease